MPFRTTITGTRATTHRGSAWFGELFGRYLRPFAHRDTHFHIGGANGIDTLTLRWLAERSESRLTVVVPGLVAQQPATARGEIDRCRQRIDQIVELGEKELGAAAYHARNRWMVDRSELVIGFPREGTAEGTGTWQTLNYGAVQGKPRLIVPV